MIEVVTWQNNTIVQTATIAGNLAGNVNEHFTFYVFTGDGTAGIKRWPALPPPHRLPLPEWPSPLLPGHQSPPAKALQGGRGVAGGAL